MKFIATSDIHLGREPTNIPLDARKQYRTASIWEKIVAHAIQERVDGIVISGDLVDARNKFFEAIGPLEKGLKDLLKHQIAVFAIAGNHDYDVLPRIHASLKNPLFFLLGTQQKWEVIPHQTASGERIQIVGYSFSQLHIPHSPFKTFPKLLIDPQLPTIGLLHTDYEIADSRYCPSTRAEVRASGIPLWIFGHIHKPQVIEIDELTQAIYPGSPQGMDPAPSEGGIHGPWMIHYNDLKPACKQIPLAPLQYDHLEINISGIYEIVDFQQALHENISKWIRETLLFHPKLQFLSLRLKIIGTTPLKTCQIEEQLEVINETGLIINGVSIYINQFQLQLSPEIDLKTLAASEDIKGQLAKFILEPGDPSFKPLIEEIANLAKTISEEVPFLGTGVVPLGKESLRDLFLSQASALMGVLSEKGGDHGRT